jgi:hypothetical protein
MSLRNFLLSRFFSLLVCAVSSQSAFSQSIPYDLVPESLHVFKLQKTTDFDEKQRGLGRSFTFSMAGSEGVSISIYIYDKGLSRIPEGASSNQLLAEFQQAKIDISRSRTRALQIGEDQEIAIRDLQYRFAAFSIPQQTDPNISFLFMTARGNLFIKIRSSMLRDYGLDESLRHQEFFINELSRELSARLPRASSK